jgi:hypothetical protein
MRSWNLSTFEELLPEVLVPIEKESSATFKAPRKYKPQRFRTSGGRGRTLVVVAAMTLGVLTVNAQGSDTKLRFSSPDGAVSNVLVEKLPLALVFSGQHPLKWDDATEKDMLSKAAAAVARANKNANEANLIQASLTEKLPSTREEAFDLSKLGIKLR